MVDEKLARSRGGNTAETSKKQYAQEGLWEHPETGARIFTVNDPLYGNGTSEAAKRTGFVWKRALEPGDIKSLPEINAERRRAEERKVNPDDLKGALARIDQLEQANAQLRGAVPASEDVPGSADVKANASKAVADHEESKHATGVLDEAPEAVSKPLKDQNTTELLFTAENEGVETEGLDTKKKLATAIEAKRAEAADAEEESAPEPDGKEGA